MQDRAQNNQSKGKLGSECGKGEPIRRCLGGRVVLWWELWFGWHLLRVKAPEKPGRSGEAASSPPGLNRPILKAKMYSSL